MLDYEKFNISVCVLFLLRYMLTRDTILRDCLVSDVHFDKHIFITIFEFLRAICNC